MSLNPDDFLAILPDAEPLDDIGPEAIKKAKKEKLIISMNGNKTGVNADNFYIIAYMNGWLIGQ